MKSHKLFCVGQAVYLAKDYTARCPYGRTYHKGRVGLIVCLGWSNLTHILVAFSEDNNGMKDITYVTSEELHEYFVPADYITDLSVLTATRPKPPNKRLVSTFHLLHSGELEPKPKPKPDIFVPEDLVQYDFDEEWLLSNQDDLKVWAELSEETKQTYSEIVKIATVPSEQYTKFNLFYELAAFDKTAKKLDAYIKDLVSRIPAKSTENELNTIWNENDVGKIKALFYKEAKSLPSYLKIAARIREKTE